MRVSHHFGREEINIQTEMWAASSTSTLRAWRAVDAEHMAPQDRVRPLSVGSSIQLDRHGRPPSRCSPPKAFWVAAWSTPSEVVPKGEASRSTVSPRRASKANPSVVGAAVRSAATRLGAGCSFT